MARKQSSSGAKTPRGWLPKQLPEAWVRLQIYPDAVQHPKTGQDYEQKAKTVLAKSGPGNLRFLCSSAGIFFRPEHDSPEQLAGRLLESDSRTELIYLATFHRRRKPAVVEFFESATSEGDRLSLDSEVAAHCSRRQETVKPFTKLIYLYRSNPSLLEGIHYRYAWRRLPTIFAYSVTPSLVAQSSETLSRELDSLVAALDRLKPGETYEVFGHSHLTESVTVFVVHRRYPPAVRADYENTFRLQHDFSTLAFSVDMSSTTVSVKIANRALAETVRDWVSETLHVTLNDAGASLFSDYQPESVESAFLGGYDESHGIDLLQLHFRHSFGPNHSPLALTAAEYSRSIREDLAWLKQTGMVRLRSLADIDAFRVRFEGYEVDVTSVTEKGGAIRFRMNDANLTEQLAASLRSTFSKTFLVPLDQSIDPTLLAMGPTDIYHFLMAGVSESQVQPYQREALGKLLTVGLLKTVEGKVGRCTDLQCPSHSKTVSDPMATECPVCQGQVEWVDFLRYDEDQKVQLRVVREVLERATGWKMNPVPLSFESHKFYRLSSSKNPGKTVCVFVNDRMSSGKMETFHRAMFPLIVVHPLGQQGLPVIDAVGIAHVGLPYMLAASDVSEDWKKFRQGCKELIPRLLWMEKERVLKASRLSHDHMLSRPEGYDDRSYEADVFNLLRSLFSFTVKWGGGNKPDGFSSLVYFPENDLSSPTKFNWSYDAKFSDSTYEFGIGEHRQMFDYVRRLHAPKRLKSLGNRYNAHVIITNSMSEASMKNAAAFMRTQHRLGEEHPEFHMVFMRDSFLIRLWELIRNSELEFEKRGTYLAEFFVKAVVERVQDGYCLLDDTVAAELAEEVLDQDPVQQPVDAEKVKSDLAQQTKIRPRRKTAS